MLVVAAVVCHFVAISSLLHAPAHGLSGGPRWRRSSTCCGASPTRRRATRCATVLLGDVAPGCCEPGPGRSPVNVHDAAAAEAPSPAPAPAGEPTHVAQVSVWVDSYDRRGDLDARGGRGRPARSAPTSSPSRSTTTTARTPHAGAPHVARRRALARRPHRGPDPPARPASATTSGSSAGTARSHPRRAASSPAPATSATRWCAPLTAGAPEVHGIVEEGWPSAAHVADPMLFFNADGDPARLDGQPRRDDGQRRRLPRPGPPPQHHDDRVPRPQPLAEARSDRRSGEDPGDALGEVLAVGAAEPLEVGAVPASAGWARGHPAGSARGAPRRPSRGRRRTGTRAGRPSPCCGRGGGSTGTGPRSSARACRRGCRRTSPGWAARRSSRSGRGPAGPRWRPGRSIVSNP